MNFLGMLNSNAIATITNVLLSSLLIFLPLEFLRKVVNRKRKFIIGMFL